MIRVLFAFAVLLMLAACEATVSAPQPTLNPNTPQAPIGTPPTLPGPTDTRVPTNTPGVVPPSVTPEPTALAVTPDVPVVTLSPLVITDLEPPLRMRLPNGWTSVSDAIVLPGLFGRSTIPFGYYSGPVTGGKGVITVLYGFNNIVPQFGDQRPNVYADALRLLLFTVIEPDCEYSFEEEKPYTVGGLPARGTVYAASDCPEGLPSLQGWFAALEVEGMNFAFYAYTEPYSGFNSASSAELQGILDSVVFDFSLLPTVASVTPAP